MDTKGKAAGTWSWPFTFI